MSLGQKNKIQMSLEMWNLQYTEKTIKDKTTACLNLNLYRQKTRKREQFVYIFS